MIISNDFPPIWPQLQQTFPGLEKFKPIVTYGDTIYNPYNVHIDPALEFHEQTHAQRQGFTPQHWWANYLISPEFRFQEELIAYRAQYQYAKAHYNRKDVRTTLDHISTALS